MRDQFYTGDPSIDSVLFLGLILLIVGPIFLLILWGQEKSEDLKFEKAKERFWKEVEEGKEPDWVPKKILPDGRAYTDPDCLVRTKMFKKHIKGIDKIVKQDKETRGE